MDLHACRVGLSNAAAGLSGWQRYEADPGDPRLPAVIVRNPTRIVPNQDYGGRHLVDFEVELRVPIAGDHRKAIKRLDDALSVLVDQLAGTDDGPWSDLEIPEAGPYRPVDSGNTPALTCPITVSLTL